MDLGQLRQQEIHLPPYWGEIPAPPAPSYLQAKQFKAMKQSPLWAATPNAAVESPKPNTPAARAGITIAQDEP